MHPGEYLMKYILWAKKNAEGKKWWRSYHKSTQIYVSFKKKKDKTTQAAKHKNPCCKAFATSDVQKLLRQYFKLFL